METLEQQFYSLYVSYVATKQEENNRLITFLQQLNEQQKKEIATQVKKLSKELTDAGGAEVLCSAAFVCCNEKDWTRMFAWQTHNFLNSEVFRGILPWYCPAWFGNFVNNNDTPFQYKDILAFEEKGYLQPSPKLLAETLAYSINFHDEDKIQRLQKRQATLQTHIWYLFDFETSISFYDNYKYKNATGNTDDIYTWKDLLKRLSEKNLIDRNRLLNNAITAISKGFTQALTTWFTEMFLYLQPSTEELLQQQQAIFQSFGIPYSKPVTQLLQAIKDIAGDGRFNSTEFLSNLPVLFSNSTKAMAQIILSITDKIAKAHSEEAMAICEALCHALLHKDKSIQQKAAALIASYGAAYKEQLQPVIAQYSDTLSVDAKKTLTGFISHTEQVVETVAIEKEQLETVNIGNEIQVPADINELVFLASQAFNNNAPYHIDILPAALIKLHPQVKEEHVVLFEPAIQQAYKVVMNDLTADRGLLDNLLATFFITYAQLLAAQYPGAAKNIAAMHRDNCKKTAEKGKYDHWGVQELDKWAAPYCNGNEYETHKRLLNAAMQKIQQGDTLPMLSTPVQEPAFIPVEVLAQRLQAYAKANVTPDATDLQVAIARFVTRNKQQELQAINQLLTGEYKNLLTFLVVENELPQAPFTHETAWLMAGLTKQPEQPYEAFKNFSCNTQPHSYLTGQLNWQLKTGIKKYGNYDVNLRKHVEIQKEEATIEADFIIANYYQNSSRQMVQEHLKLNGKYETHGHKDITRIIFLLPNQPEPVLAQVIMQCLNEVDFTEEAKKKKVFKTLEAIHRLNYKFTEMSYLLIAASMMCSDKTCRAYAGEIWADRLIKNAIDSQHLGVIVGKLYAAEMAPVKRFTDLVHDLLYKRSTQHDLQLQQMIEAIIKELLKEPIKDLKKILELYYELLNTNKANLESEAIKLQLQLWQSSTTLKPVIKKLLSVVC